MLGVMRLKISGIGISIIINSKVYNHISFSFVSNLVCKERYSLNKGTSVFTPSKSNAMVMELVDGRSDKTRAGYCRRCTGNCRRYTCDNVFGCIDSEFILNLIMYHLKTSLN